MIAFDLLDKALQQCWGSIFFWDIHGSVWTEVAGFESWHKALFLSWYALQLRFWIISGYWWNSSKLPRVVWDNGRLARQVYTLEIKTFSVSAIPMHKSFSVFINFK